MFATSALLLLALLAPAAAQTGKADKQRDLTGEERIELIRGLNAEFAKVKVFLPRSKKPLKFNADGTYDKAGWSETGRDFGPVARVGDQVQITKVDIEDDRITLQINGGFNPRGKWYERIEGGVGTGTRTAPLSRDLTRTAGTTVSLVFPSKMKPISPAEVKKLLSPILDFDKRSATENYFDSLPPEIQEAIKAKRAEIGMNREQVKMAMGNPRDRLRETKDGLETEDWIYGLPPGKITFVTFANGKVIKVKDSYAGLGGSTVSLPKNQ